MRRTKNSRQIKRLVSSAFDKRSSLRCLRMEPLERRDLLSATITHGETTINMDFVEIGDPGNPADGTGYGRVDYPYQIGKYEVREFQWDAVSSASGGDLLNDPGYWNGNQPVAQVSWNEAAMFTNWLTSGDVTRGVYRVNAAGVVTGIDRVSARSTYGTIYFIPTESEWYKAAYYDSDKPGGAGYWDYPTKHDDPDVPLGIHLGDNSFDAVFNQGYNQNRPNGVEDAGVLSAFGTMGQGGNVFEWNETAFGSLRRVRGGAYVSGSNELRADYQHALYQTDELIGVGFRVAAVEGVDQLPVVGAPLQDVTVDEDAPDLASDLTGHFSDPDGETLTITAVSDSPSLVTARVDGTQLVLDFQENQNGQATITLTATDPWGGSVVDTFFANVTPVNDAPTAIGDTYVLALDFAFSVPSPGVLRNDQDLEADSLSARLADGPQHGSLLLESDGSFVYTPDPGFHGVDQFTYVANDGAMNSSPATVQLRVVDKAPTSTIGDIVWNDRNANGIQDSFERGIGGVIVELLDANEVVVATTTTDAGGAYRFAASTETEYRLRFTAPAGYDFSPAHAGSSDAHDSDADSVTGVTPLFSLDSGQTIMFPSGTDDPDSLHDGLGLGTGFTHRLPGTGALLPEDDPNLSLSTNPGMLAITSTRATTVPIDGPTLDILEAYGLYLPDTLGEDISFSMCVRDVQLGSTLSNGLYIFAGNSAGEVLLGGFHTNSPTDLAPSVWAVQNAQVVDGWQSSAGLSNGDDVILTLTRTDGRWQFSWKNLTQNTSGMSAEFSLPWIDDDGSLYVGIHYQSPRTDVAETSLVEWFQVSGADRTDWDAGIHEHNDVPVVSDPIEEVVVDEDAPDATIDLYSVFRDADDPRSSLSYTVVGNTNPGLFSSLQLGADLFIGDHAGNKVLLFDRNGQSLGTLPQVEMSGPVAMTIGPGDSPASEDLYISDCFTNRVLRFDGVTHEFKAVFVAAGSGGLYQPHGLTFGPDGNLYVASFSSDQVLRYDGTTGAFLGVFALGSGGVTDVAFGPDGNLYATNRYAGKVTRHDGTTGAYLDDFVPAGSGGWNNLYYLAFRPDGYLYVNTQGGSVLRYDGTTGAFIGEFAAGQIGPSIAFGPDGDLYVQSSNGVQRYSGSNGTFLDAFVSPGSGGLIGPSGMAFSAHKSLTLDFAPNAHGTARITLRATDPLGAWQDTQFTVVAAPVNDAPSAADDVYEFPPGDAYVSAPGVLGNDSDIDGDSLTAVLVDGPQHGSVALERDGSFVYTPDPGYFGSDQFTYAASDGALSSAPAIVALRVSPVRLVKDINLVEDGFFPTEQHRRAVVGGQVFFAGDDAVRGLELWVTDGTAEGTRLVKDIYPGVTSSDPGSFTVFNNLLYFVATDPDKGRELWRSDGTATGTAVVKDIHTEGSANPNVLAVYQGLLYFSAYHPDTGQELWRTDGTAAGTVLVKDICPGTGSSAPGAGVVSGNYMFFTANNGVTGTEPWRTDGTETGTIFLKDTNPTSRPIYPGSMTDVNGTLMFQAYASESALHGLWRSDGTPSGTYLVKALPSYSVGDFAAVNGKLFFSYRGDLWRSNGTSGGTYMVKTMQWAHNFRNVNGELYFLAWGAPGCFYLHKSDGTDAGTVRISMSAGVVGEMAAVNGVVYYVGEPPDSGRDREIWRSDGTSGGTYKLKDINPDQTSSFLPSFLTAFNGNLLFSALHPAAGLCLWSSNGTEAGTAAVTAVDTRTGNADPDQIVATSAIGPNGTVYFVADDNVHGRELWISDGTATGTRRLTDIHPGAAGSSIGSLTMLNETLFFTVDDPVYGLELWRSNGTSEGTGLVRDINPGGGGSSPQYLTAVDDLLYFIAYDDSHGSELWKSDGTADGTNLVKDLVTGPSGAFWGNSPALTNVEGLLYFFAVDAAGAVGLWKSDGYDSGTVPVKTIHPQAGNMWQWPTALAVGSTLYYVAHDPQLGIELFKSDGTGDGTAVVRDIVPGEGGSSMPQYLTRLDGTVFFVASEPSAGRELWKTDGTWDGTVPVKDIYPGDAWHLEGLTAVGELLYFVAADGIHGRELWKSDGTDVGTAMVKDIYPGAEESYPQDLVNENGVLFFTANHPLSGRELWRSDGTISGTVLVADIQPGIQASSPDRLTVSGDALYFSAADVLTGRELWLLPLDQTGPIGNAPTAANDAYFTTEDRALTIGAAGVLGNDVDLDSDPLAAVLAAGPQHGSVVLQADGSFVYTPDGDFSGEDSFTYMANDGTFDSRAATVSINIIPLANRRIAHGSATLHMKFVTVGNAGNPTDATGRGSVSYTYEMGQYEVSEDQWHVAVDSNPSDLLGSPGLYTGEIPVASITWNEAAMYCNWLTSGDVTSGPYIISAGGVVTGVDRSAALATYGRIYFLPTEDEWYKAAFYDPDKPGGSGYWDYASRHDAPQMPDGIDFAGDTEFDVVANDGFDQGGPNVIYNAGTLSAYGTVGQNGNVWEFTETLVDGARRILRGGSFPNYISELSSTSSVGGVTPYFAHYNTGFRVASIGADEPNDRPIADNDAYSTNEDQLLPVELPGVLINDTDADGDTLTALLASGPAHGTLLLNVDGSFSYMPARNYFGQDSFTYKANDGLKDSSTGSVVITVLAVPDAPVAAGDSYQTSEETPLSIVLPADGVLGNDRDADNDVLKAVLVSGPSHGELNLNLDGTFHYSPVPDYYGHDSFTYKANDGALDSNVATVSITVTPVIDLPAAANDAYSIGQNRTLPTPAPGVLGNDTVDYAVSAPIYLETVRIEHAANSNDDTGYGGVAREYSIGKYELTNAQYVEFLNAVAASDPYGLYDESRRWDPMYGIARSGSDGQYTYAVKDDAPGQAPGGSDFCYADKPVVFVSWFDAVRFVNWLTSGQTESGTYTITDGVRDWGTVTVPDHALLTNGWFLPTANEWYKAAYFDAAKPGGAGYWDYATGTDTMPDNALPSADSGNSANYSISTGNWNYPTTGTGAYAQSGSPLGTFDQTGNVFELTEAAGVWGGGWAGDASYLPATSPPMGLGQGFQDFWFGFRIAHVAPMPRAILQSDPSHGTLIWNDTGAFTYTPETGFHGEDSFTYKVNDGRADSALATVTVTVLPVRVTLSGPDAADEGQTKHYSFTTSDPGGEPFSIVDLAVESVGTISALSFDENTGAGSFDVTFNDSLATSTVSVQVRDSCNAVSNRASIQVHVANKAPTAGVSGPTDGFQGVRGQTRTFILSATDSAAQDEAAGFTFSVDWGDGSTPEEFFGLSGTQAGHAFGAPGTYTIHVTATDKDGGVSDSVTQSIAINVSEVQGTRLVIGGTGNDDQLAIAPNGTNVTLTLNGSSLGTVTLPADGLLFSAGAGNDQLIFNGTSTADLFTSGQDWVGRGEVRATGESVETYQANGLGGNDTLTAVAGNVGFDGGSGTDRLVAADAENQWVISGTNAGGLNGQTFASIENLTGGTETDVFAFAGSGSVSGQIDGGGGANRFDYSARSSSASVSLAGFTATGTGGFNSIQAFVGSPAASDTLTGPNTANSWQLADAGKGTLNGSYTFDGFENLTGNGQSDSFRFLFSAVGPGFGTVNGGSGNDVLDYSAVASPVFVNLLSRAASGLTVYSSIESFIGGSADDDLFGSNSATTWTINGTDSGTAGAIPFGSFEILHGGSGNDLFTLVGAGAAVTGSLHGGDGTDTLAGPALANNWIIENFGGGTLRTSVFAGIENLTGGTETDVFAFAGSGSVSGQIDGGGGTNQFDYSARSSSASVSLAGFTATGTGGFNNIQAFVGSPAASDTLTGPNTANSWQLADAGKGTLNGSYTFDGFENLTGNGQSDSFRFLFSAVGPGFGTVNGGSGNDVLDYSAVASPVFVNLLSRSASGLTVYSSVESFIGGSAADDLLGSNSATTWTINGTDSGTAGAIPFGSFEILHGGSGNDLFTLVGAGAAVTGSLHGGDGTDTLAGPALANNWTIESAGGGTLRTTIFAGIENLTGGSGADSFAFVDDGDIDGVINGGSGTDILSYALVPGPIAVELVGRTGTRLGSFTSIESLVATGDSGDVLSGSNATNAWSITSQNSGTVGATAFSGFEELVGGTGADTYTMTNAAARISGLIDGASGTDTLVSPPVNSMWLIDVPGGGSLTPRATTADTRFRGIENLTGGSLEDYFRMGTTGQVLGNLNGGSGNNVLSYETWSTAVVVNLQTNVATAVTGALSNIAVVLGGGGSDLLTAPSSRNAVLVGNGGNDVLTGGGGRNVLIGGNGADTLRGSGGDDLLIAGRTSFDLDPDALLAVFAEWSTTSRNYVTRVANLRGTGSGTRLNGNYFLALNDTIFGDEGAVDLLTGGSGRDWFFGNSGEDQISDRVASGTQLEYLN